MGQGLGRKEEERKWGREEEGKRLEEVGQEKGDKKEIGKKICERMRERQKKRKGGKIL